MAKRGTVKNYSLTQEEFVAKTYDGTRSPSSGAADNDGGDVRAERDLIECKVTGRPGKKVRSTSVSLDVFEKIAEEAHLEGRSPVIALRFWDADSPLANLDGWVDLSVRLMAEDAELREDQLKLEAKIESEYERALYGD